MHPLPQHYHPASQLPPQKSGPTRRQFTIGGALALFIAFGTWALPTFWTDLFGPDDTDTSTGSESAGPTPEEGEEWELHFDEKELRLTAFLDDSGCYPGAIDLDVEEPEAELYYEGTEDDVELHWALCDYSMPGDWSGAESCDIDFGCLAAGDISIQDGRLGAVVADATSFDAAACYQAVKRGGDNREGEGNNVRWNLRLDWDQDKRSESESPPESNGMCIATGEELFRITYGEIGYVFDKTVNEISELEYVIYVTSWTPA